DPLPGLFACPVRGSRGRRRARHRGRPARAGGRRSPPQAVLLVGTVRNGREISSSPMASHSRRFVLAGLLVAVAAPVAHAGRTHYGWLYGTEVNPERGVELETWILQENGKGPVNETLVWWGPVVGLTERLELAIPLEMAYEEEGDEAGTDLRRFGGEL